MTSAALTTVKLAWQLKPEKSDDDPAFDQRQGVPLSPTSSPLSPSWAEIARGHRERKERHFDEGAGLADGSDDGIGRALHFR
jgi:hypothetical protein